jgi:hypothetical protein
LTRATWPVSNGLVFRAVWGTIKQGRTVMLTKKLKKIEKECRKADDPVLLTLAAYVDHVANYLERSKDDDVKAKEYRDALGGLDLSVVVKAYEALAVTEQESRTLPVESLSKEEKRAAKKAKKKEARKEKEREAQAVVTPPTSQESDEPSGPAVESSSGEEGKKRKKNKKKGLRGRPVRR